jgi:transcriptional regulator with XRE-family HTH domain
MVRFDPSRFKAYRQRNSLSIRELARRVGVSPSQIARWEREESLPSVRQFCRVLDRMHARADRFFVYTPARRARISDNGGAAKPAPRAAAL